MADSLGAPHALVSRYDPPDRLRIVGGWSHGRPVDTIEYTISGTPCEQVILQGAGCHHFDDLGERFPEFTVVRGAECYLAAPLLAHDGIVLGLACLLNAHLDCAA